LIRRRTGTAVAEPKALEVLDSTGDTTLTHGDQPGLSFELKEMVLHFD
jgi:hypothetical protein